MLANLAKFLISQIAKLTNLPKWPIRQITKLANLAKFPNLGKLPKSGKFANLAIRQFNPI